MARALAPSWQSRGLFWPLFAGLALLAWLTLWLWSASPYGRYLDHGDWTQVGIAASICRALPAGDLLLPALLYVAGWLLMIGAMMLPTTAPLIDIFRRLVARYVARRRLMAILLGGYLLVWVGFGVAAHLASLGLILLVQQSTWLTFNGWLIGAVVVALAGLFQFSDLKYRCLDACRTPLAFVATRWRGQNPWHEAFRIGLGHGLYCLGCCWALMLLMVALGTGSVGWMLALGAVMAFEKNHAWGHHLGKPLGIVLLGWSMILTGAGLMA